MLSQLLVVHRRQAREVVEVRGLYRKEAMQRKLLYNEVTKGGVVFGHVTPHVHANTLRCKS